MSDRIYYRKLIRDNIPDEITAWGGTHETRELTEEEFRVELRRKVPEEASAIPGAESKTELMKELADLQVVIDALRLAEGITDKQMKEALEENKERKGGFAKRLFLEWSSNTGYKSNEQTT